MMRGATIAARLEAYSFPEPNSGCWIWTAYIDEKGYGHLRVDERVHAAHRLSYALHKGDIPAGMMVCHYCDTPSCINPEHLFVGTAQDNALDMAAKGRQHLQRNPTATPGAKLTEAAVLEIRAAHIDGVPVARLARLFGMSWWAIDDVVRRVTWKSLQHEGPAHQETGTA